MSTAHVKPEKISPLVIAEQDSNVDERLKVAALHKEHLSSIRKMNVTSDYESCNESPSSSDHSDNILTSDDLSSGSPPKKVINRVRDFRVHHEEDESREAVADDEDDGEEDELDSEIQQIKTQTEPSSELYHKHTTDSIEQKDTENLVLDIDSCSLFQIECLNDWDYPIFDVANSNRNFILSKVSDCFFVCFFVFLVSYHHPVT